MTGARRALERCVHTVAASIVACLLLLIVGCNSSPQQTSAIEMDVPSALRAAPNVNYSDVYAEVTINDGAIQTFSVSENESVSVTGIKLNEQNSILVVWFETYLNQPLELARQSGGFLADSASNTAEINFPYDYSADDNANGKNNITERADGTCPFLASTGFCSTETIPNPTAFEPTPPSETEVVPQLERMLAGCFIMGSPLDEPFRDVSEVQHQVCFANDFAIGRYEVTTKQFETIMNPAGDPATASNNPKINVSLIRALEYTQKLSDNTGRQFRLPTEEEWEYAARGGTITPFHTGELITSAQANFNGLHPWDGQPTGGTNRQGVITGGNFPPNDFGLYDVHGNVAEWTCSIYTDAFDGSEKVCTDPSSDDQEYVIRGGAYFSQALGVRSAGRNTGAASYVGGGTGFRIVETF